MENQLLQDYIKKNVSVSDNDLDFFLSLFRPLKLKKNDFFLKAGGYCNEVAFVQSGMLRIWHTNERGEETTCYFGLENEFVTSFSAFNAHTISSENVQAIMATECFVISKENLDRLYKEVPATQELGRKAAEKVAMFMEKRMSSFLNHSASERYEFLLKEHPVLIRTVPLQILASFIGITPQHLSRLRKNSATV